MTEKYITNDVTGTFDVASSFANTLKPGAVVSLTGELGSGKTVFAKGVARALGVKDNVVSPTFTLINEYHGDEVIYHMDFYRLNSLEEILNIGVDDYFFSDGICLVEWAEKMGKIFPDNAIKVVIIHVKGNNREIIIERPD